MATASTRALWKGAISFGLVHIPVALHGAVEEIRPKMKMVDQGTGAAVGHKNVSKATGEEVQASDIVKAMEVDRGQYVALTKEEIRTALPKSTQLVEIEAFPLLADVPIVFFQKPYYVSPTNKGAKPYALLREVLKRTGRVGLGRVVVSTKQHLAVVATMGDALVLNLVRWAEEVRTVDGLPIPGEVASVGVTEKELAMGEQLVLDLATGWEPEQFKDDFRKKIEALVEAKRKTGDVLQLPGFETAEALPEASNVVDLTELLRRSLRGKTTKQAEVDEKPTPTRRKAAANDEAAPLKKAAAKKSDGKARISARAAAKGK